MALLWAIAIVLAVVGSAWALVPIALANVVLFCCSPPRRTPWRLAWSRAATTVWYSTLAQKGHGWPGRTEPTHHDCA
jgi:hypothetical protein